MLKNPDIPAAQLRPQWIRSGPFLLLYRQTCVCMRKPAGLFECDGGAKPWEFQFGMEYSSARPTGLRPFPSSPSTPICVRRSNFGGNVCHRNRLPMAVRRITFSARPAVISSARSDQYEFYNQYEEKVEQTN